MAPSPRTSIRGSPSGVHGDPHGISVVSLAKLQAAVQSQPTTISEAQTTEMDTIQHSEVSSLRCSTGFGKVYTSESFVAAVGSQDLEGLSLGANSVGPSGNTGEADVGAGTEAGVEAGLEAGVSGGEGGRAGEVANVVRRARRWRVLQAYGPTW